MKKSVFYWVSLLVFNFVVSHSVFSQGECAANFSCDQVANKTVNFSSNRDFGGFNSSNGGKIYCLTGDQGGFDYTGNLQLNSDVILCIDQSNDGNPINITGNVSYNSGVAQVYVYGESTWSNSSGINNETHYNIESTGDLTMTNSLQIRDNSSFTNNGALTFTNSIELSNGVDITNNGTFDAQNQITILSGSNSVISNTGTMTVGSADFRSGSSLTNSGNITFSGNATMDDFDVTSSGTMTFNGTATIKNGTDVISSGIMNFNNTTFASNTTSITNSGTMGFAENAELKDGMTVTNSGNMSFDKNLTMPNADFTNNANATVTVLGNMSGNNSSDFYNSGLLDVKGDVYQDFKLYNYNRVEIEGDLTMADFFDNRGGIFVDGIMRLQPDQPNFFDQGYFVSDSLVFQGSASFGTGASTCALFISRKAIHNSGTSLTENEGTVAFVSGADITDDGNNRYPDMDTLSFVDLSTLPADITDAQATDFTDDKLQDYLSDGCALHPLPIQLLSFNGLSKETFNLIQFETGFEINNDYIVLQKSLDGKNWYDVQIFEGTGDKYHTGTYVYEDYDQNSNSYYRLKQYDLDGESYTSHSIVVSKQGNEFFTYISNGELKIYSESGVKPTVSIFDVRGVVIYSATEVESIDLTSFTTDVLLVNLNGVQTEKIINFK